MFVLDDHNETEKARNDSLDLVVGKSHMHRSKDGRRRKNRREEVRTMSAKTRV